MMRKIAFAIAALALIGVGYLARYTQAGPPVVRKEAIAAPAPAPAAAAPSAPQLPVCVDTTYTVPYKGHRINSLWRIAKEVYRGRAYLWPLIAEANGIVSPYVIQPDQVLKIPMTLCGLAELETPLRSDKVVKKAAAPKKTSASLPEKKLSASIPTPPVPPPAAAPAPQPAAPKAEAATPPAPIPPREPAPAPAVAAQQEEAKPVVPPPAEVPTIPKLPELKQRISAENIASPTLTPGSAWNTLLTVPVERGNWINQFHIDQGVILARPAGIAIEPYVAVNVTQDTKGYDWNNKTKVEAGLKLGKTVSHGVMNVSFAYADERREYGGSRSGFTVYHDAWFGRDIPNDSPGTRYFKAAPGYVWWIVGNVSPFEKGNVIGLARAEQGVAAVKTGGISLIPTAWLQGGFDTDGNPWNRRYTAGGGGKIAIPWHTGTIGVTGGYECTRSYDDKAPSGAACGPTVRVDFWTGWRKIGGK
jgi:hypothetical protein